MPEMTRTTVAAMLAALGATGALAQDEAAPQEPPATQDQDAGGEGEAPGESGADAGADEEDALGLSMGNQGPQVGQTYTQEEHGDWDVRCVRTESGNDPCQLYQLLQDQDGNNVAEISLFPLPESNGQAVAGATVITPLETLLTAQIALSVDGSEPKRYPFGWCSSVGCFSRIGFTADEVVRFRRGAEATLTIRPVAAPDQTVDLGISLAGFTAGYEAVAEANAAAQGAASE